MRKVLTVFVGSMKLLLHTSVRKKLLLVVALAIALCSCTPGVSAQGRVKRQQTSAQQQQQAILQQFGVDIKPCPPGVSPCVCRVTPAGHELECSAMSEAAQLQLVSALQEPNHFHKIILQRSRLIDLPSEAFGEATADIYVVQNNPLLESIEIGAFGQFANLKEIIVQRNPVLEEFPFYDVKKWLDLEKFVLTDNRILEVPDYGFEGASSKLREIHLQRNIILDLGPLAFRGLPELQHLDLSGNQIASLGAGTLFFTEPLKMLDLSRNRIASIDVKAFEDPARAGSGSFAEYIDFSNNLFTFLEQAKWESVFRKLDAFKTTLEEPVTTTTAFNPFLILQQFQQMAATTVSLPSTTTILPVEPTSLNERNPEALFFQFLQSLLERGALPVTTTPLPTTISAGVEAAAFNLSVISTSSSPGLETSTTTPSTLSMAFTTTTTVPTTSSPQPSTAAVVQADALLQEKEPVVLNDRVGSIWTSILTELDQLIEARRSESAAPLTSNSVVESSSSITESVDQSFLLAGTSSTSLPSDGSRTTSVSTTTMQSDSLLLETLPPLTDALVSANTVSVDKLVENSLQKQQRNIVEQNPLESDGQFGLRSPKALPAESSQLNRFIEANKDVTDPSASAKPDLTWDTPGFDGTPSNASDIVHETLPGVAETKGSIIQAVDQAENPGLASSIHSNHSTHEAELHAGFAQAKELFQESFLRQVADVPVLMQVTDPSVAPASVIPQDITSEPLTSTMPISTVISSTTTEKATTMSTVPIEMPITTEKPSTANNLVITGMPDSTPSSTAPVPSPQVEETTLAPASSSTSITSTVIPSTSTVIPSTSTAESVLHDTAAGASSTGTDPALQRALASIALLRQQLEAALQSIPLTIAAALGGAGPAAPSPLGNPISRRKRAIEMALLSRTKRQNPAEVLPESKSIKGSPPAAARPLFSINFNNNPFRCDCEMQWLFFDRFKYADQILGVRCENRVNVFQLSTVHFMGC